MARGVAYSIISAICLGTLAILAKLGLSLGMAPLEIVQYRFFFGAILLFGWLAITNPDLLKIRPRGLAKAALLGGCLYPVQSWLFIKALQTIPASTTSLLYYLYPLTTTLIAVVFLGLRPGRQVLAALGLILAGCGLVFHDAFAREMDESGILAALGCMAVFSVYLTLVQIFTRHDEARRISVWVVGFMALVVSLLSPPLNIMNHHAAGWCTALALGLVPTALAVSLLYRAVESIGGAYTAIFSTIEPVTTVLLAALVLGESVRASQIAGMVLIIAGIALPNLGLVRRGSRIAPPRDSRPSG